MQTGPKTFKLEKKIFSLLKVHHLDFALNVGKEHSSAVAAEPALCTASRQTCCKKGGRL